MRGSRAAQYVRMSTDLQKYSLENQASAIAAYAAQRGLEIVRDYVDSGRSGVTIENREALQRLIADVRAGTGDFAYILVYDVSRWGRFQDADESAYYEFICKNAGIKVLYCAEQFENDGALFSTMMKNIKRVMAGEYSRELSVKVFAGGCRTAQLGFKQGGQPTYALQRVLVDENRVERCLLGPGQRKNLLTDRVLLRPGSREQVDTVRRIFQSFVVERKSELSIARELNGETVFNQFGRPWQMLGIRRLLTCEQYVGNYVYNRTSSKLGRRKIENPPDEWVRCENALEAIIDPAIFAAARKIIENRPRRTLRAWPSNAEILHRLSRLLNEHGRLTAETINKAPDLPNSALYTVRFGSLKEAYRLIGYNPATCKYMDGRRAVVAAIGNIGGDLAERLKNSGVEAEFDQRLRVLTVNDTLTVSIYVARCQYLKSQEALRWNVRQQIRTSADLILVARMVEGNDSVLDYYLLPRKKIAKGKISFWQKSRAKLERHHFDALDDLIGPIWRALSKEMQQTG
nr:recombinase family protein [Bradyrhizobium diazoefficiens]